MEKENTYLLGVGAAGQRRLEIQHELLRHNTFSFLSRIPVDDGKKVLVVGCGLGHESEMIANLVGEESMVIAVDNSPEQLKIAHRNARAHGVSNIRYFKGSVYDLSKLFRAEFDVVYCRFLLMNLQRPMEALKEMARVLKKGGVLACEEGAYGDPDSFKESPASQCLLHLMLSLARVNGNDFSVGFKLDSFFSDLNLSDRSALVSQVLMTTKNHRLIPGLMAIEITPQVLKHQLVDVHGLPMTAARMDALVLALNQEYASVSEENPRYFEVVQASGRK